MTRPAPRIPTARRPGQPPLYALPQYRVGGRRQVSARSLADGPARSRGGAAGTGRVVPKASSKAGPHAVMKPPTADTNRRPVESDKATSEKPATRQPARVVRVGGSVRTAPGGLPSLGKHR